MTCARISSSPGLTGVSAAFSMRMAAHHLDLRRLVAALFVDADDGAELGIGSGRYRARASHRVLHGQSQRFALEVARSLISNRSPAIDVAPDCPAASSTPPSFSRSSTRTSSLVADDVSADARAAVDVFHVWLHASSRSCGPRRWRRRPWRAPPGRPSSSRQRCAGLRPARPLSLRRRSRPTPDRARASATASPRVTMTGGCCDGGAACCAHTGAAMHNTAARTADPVTLRILIPSDTLYAVSSSGR